MDFRVLHAPAAWRIGSPDSGTDQLKKCRRAPEAVVTSKGGGSSPPFQARGKFENMSIANPPPSEICECATLGEQEHANLRCSFVNPVIGSRRSSGLIGRRGDESSRTIPAFVTCCRGRGW